jgi:PTS system mannose-specific IIA component
MIGIVLVCHGRLAEELLEVARTIVGDLPCAEAVSVAWSDDGTEARAAIEGALERVGTPETLLLTDMFGGTPTNLSLAFLSPQIELVSGVNLPMLIKLSQLRDGQLRDVARQIRDRGRESIYAAGEALEQG